MAVTIFAVRTELGDTDPNFPILSDDEISYYIQKNGDSLGRTCIDCAKAILMKLSMRGNETIDIFSIKGSQTAAQYMQSLKLYIRDPNLNPLMQNSQGYFGGVSKSDMLNNDANCDNNTVSQPASSLPIFFFER